MPILDTDYSMVDYEEKARAIGLKSKHMPLLIANFRDESISILDALEEAIASRDYEKIRSSAHAIKGSSGNLKFDEVYEMAKEMELSGSKEENDFEYEAYFKAIKSAVRTIPL